LLAILENKDMTMTLQEIMDTCDSWERFCDLHGFSEWAVNEGGEDVQVTLSTHQAHHLGIVKMTEWKRKPFDEVYPANDQAESSALAD